MKKLVFLFLSIFVTIIAQSQSDTNYIFYNGDWICYDSLNIRHYGERYLLPEIMTNSSCQRDGIILDVWDHSTVKYQGLMDNGYSWINDIVWDKEREYFPEKYNLLADFAQPYYTDTAITIIGLSAYQQNCEYDGYGHIMRYKFYLELRDSTLNNIIKGIDISEGETPYKTPTYTEEFFDSPINMQGKFYVVFHTPDTIIGNPTIADPHSRKSLGGAILISFLCTPNSEDLYPLYKDKDDSEWKTYLSPWTNNNTATMFYLFPILSEYNPNAEEWHGVGLNETRDISNFTHVFPNPAKEEVNINCGYKIKSLQIYDEQGKVLLEKEVNAYNYQINLNILPQGTYFIKVITNSGQTVKKIILSN